MLLPRLDKATKTGAWFGALESFGVTMQVDPVERAALPQWIAQRLAPQGQRVRAARRASARCSSLPTGSKATCWPRTRKSRSWRCCIPQGELGFEQVESAVLNVARYDVFKLSEAVLAGQAARVQRMLDGLQAEGEAEVLVHYTLAEDIRALKRVKDAMAAGRPLPMALREQRVWGLKERLFERVLPRLTATDAGQPAACGASGGRHRQGPEAARLAGRRLAGAAPAGAALCRAVHWRRSRASARRKAHRASAGSCGK